MKLERLHNWKQSDMDEENLETWSIKSADYKELNEILVPTTAEAIWKLAKGNCSYAKFNTTAIEYTIPAKF
jgi:hypothetical protein